MGDGEQRVPVFLDCLLQGRPNNSLNSQAIKKKIKGFLQTKPQNKTTLFVQAAHNKVDVPRVWVPHGRAKKLHTRSASSKQLLHALLDEEVMSLVEGSGGGGGGGQLLPARWRCCSLRSPS
ncbi:hypothetical protein QOT17_003578 [Balamuthia mandrillaris]